LILWSLLNVVMLHGDNKTANFPQRAIVWSVANNNLETATKIVKRPAESFHDAIGALWGCALNFGAHSRSDIDKIKTPIAAVTGIRNPSVSEPTSCAGSDTQARADKKLDGVSHVILWYFWLGVLSFLGGFVARALSANKVDMPSPPK
jgi:hypothetical protein